MAGVTVSPSLVRVIPFAVFALLTLGQGRLGANSGYWIYVLKTILGAGLIWSVRAYIPEMRWKFSWAAVATGVGVFLLWIGLDGPYLRLGTADTIWNPHRAFGENGALAWTVILVRIIGSTLVVPPIEEVFYRSFLYRYICRADFLAVTFEQFDWRAFAITAVIFGFSHYEWLAGILCAFAYQGLVIWKKRLGDAILAHAITNLLLGVWVVGTGDWRFW